MHIVERAVSVAWLGTPGLTAIQTSCQMTRSSGKSAYQGKPHTGSSETWDAGFWFAVPKAPDCGGFPDPRTCAFPGTELSQKTQPPNSWQVDTKKALTVFARFDQPGSSDAKPYILHRTSRL